MKIRAINVLKRSFKLTRPYTIAYKYTDTVDNIIVEIESDTALFGIGTGSPSPEVTGETIEQSLHSLHDCADWLVGKDIASVPALIKTLASRFDKAPAACAALDIALYDLYAQSLNKPLVDLFGRVHQSLPTSITIGIKNCEETLKEAHEYVARGFRVLKVKIGKSLSDDLERLTKLREVFGDKITVRVDPNQGYSVDDFLRFMQSSEALNIEFVEQPLSVKDLVHVRQLPAHYRNMIALDENLVTPQDAISCVDACGIYNIKLMKCGGLHAAQKIATIADAAGLKVMWGCMDESRVSITAALHLALASPATRYLDLDGSLDLAEDVVDGGFAIENGVMLLESPQPGLGVQRLAKE